MRPRFGRLAGIALLFAFTAIPGFADPASIPEFVDSLDPTSNQILREEAEAAESPLKDLALSVATGASPSDSTPLDSRKKAELNALLGVGFGLVDRFGISAVVLRRSAEGKPTWFIQGDAEFLRARLGYAPNDLRFGVGILPFRNTPAGIALKLTRSAYSEKLGWTPQLSHRIYPGKKDRLAITLQGAATVYFGEESARGKPYSILPDLRVGIAFRILPKGPR